MATPMTANQATWEAIERLRKLRAQIDSETPPVQQRTVSIRPPTLQAGQPGPTKFIDNEPFAAIGGFVPGGYGRSVPGTKAGIGYQSSGMTTGGVFGSGVMRGTVPESPIREALRPEIASRPMIAGKPVSPSDFAQAWRTRSQPGSQAFSLRQVAQGNAAYDPNAFAGMQSLIPGDDPAQPAVPPVAAPSPVAAASASAPLRPDQLARRSAFADAMAMRKQAAADRGRAKGDARKARIAMRQGGLAGAFGSGGDGFENYLLASAMNAPNPQVAAQAARMLTDMRNERLQSETEQGRIASAENIAKGGWASQEKQTEAQVGVQREANQLRASAEQMEREGRREDAQLAREQADRIERESARRFHLTYQQQQDEARRRDQQFELTYQQGQNQLAQGQQEIQSRADMAKLEADTKLKLANIPEGDKIWDIAKNLMATQPGLSGDQYIDQAKRIHASMTGGTAGPPPVGPITPERSQTVGSTIETIIGRPGLTPAAAKEELNRAGITDDEIRTWANQNAEGWWGRQWRTGTIGSAIRATRPKASNDAEQRRLSLIEAFNR